MVVFDRDVFAKVDLKFPDDSSKKFTESYYFSNSRSVFDFLIDYVEYFQAINVSKCLIEYLYNLGENLENKRIMADNNIVHCPRFVSDDKYLKCIRISAQIDLYKKINQDVISILKWS